MIRYFVISVLLALTFSACQDSSSIGSNLLEDDKFDVNLINDFSLTSSIILSDSLKTYRDNVSYDTYSVGEIDEPLFGSKICEIYFRMGLNGSVANPDFNKATLDSMVLILTYDSLGNYGNTDAINNLEVYELAEDISDVDSLFTEQVIAIENDIIGEKSFTAKPLDSLTIINHTDTTEQKIPAQIRVRMDQTWSEDIFSNEALYVDQAALEDEFKGFYIKNSPSTPSLLGVNIGANANSENGFNRLAVFYTDSLGAKQLYTFRIFSQRGMYIEQDRSGSLVDDLSSGFADTDSLVVVEGHRGYDTKISFNDLSVLDDKIVNHASLKVYVASLPEDEMFIYAPTSILLGYKTVDGDNSNLIQDIFDLNVIGAPLDFGYGGMLEEEGNAICYRMNITKHIKDVLNSEVEPEITLIPLLRNQYPQRTILYGAGHSMFPIELEVTYTNR
jgi:hypothetical protein